jgi:hypothetical protein
MNVLLSLQSDDERATWYVGGLRTQRFNVVKNYTRNFINDETLKISLSKWENLIAQSVCAITFILRDATPQPSKLWIYLPQRRLVSEASQLPSLKSKSHSSFLSTCREVEISLFISLAYCIKEINLRKLRIQQPFHYIIDNEEHERNESCCKNERNLRRSYWK